MLIILEKDSITGRLVNLFHNSIPSGIWVDLKSEKTSTSFDCDFSASGVGFIYLFIFSEALLQSYVLLALQQKRATKEVSQIIYAVAIHMLLASM